MSHPLNILESALPRVLERSSPSEAQVCFQIEITPTLACLDGHFPGHPLVPGLAQIDWVFALVGLAVTAEHSLQIKRLKFQRPMRPGQKIQLLVEFNPEQPALKFIYSDARWEYSSGEIHWAGPNAQSVRRHSCL